MTESEREPVDIGVDLRPLPLKVGEEIWYFNPDPGKTFFGRLAATAAQLQNNQSEEDVLEAMDELERLLIAELVRPGQKKSFKGKYGLGVLSALAQKLPEAITGLPTPPSPASGTKQPAGGGGKSPRG